MKKVLGIVILFFTFSCSSDLDFDQANDIELDPVFVADFAFFNVIPSQFIVGGVEQSVIRDVLGYDVFTDPFFNENLKRAEVVFKLNNTINRAYIVRLNYLDKNNLTLFSIAINVPAFTGTQNSVSQTEIFENARLELLKETRDIEFVVTMLPGPPISGSTTGSLVMNSSSTLYILVK